MQKKMFGEVNPVGKVIRYSNELDFEITGVIKDLPKTSHFQADMLLTLESQSSINSYLMESWNNSSSSFYYLLPENANIPFLEQKVAEVYDKAKPGDFRSGKFEFQPLSKIHLYSSDTTWDSAIKGDIQIVMAFALIAILILFIASFNHINLSVALAGKRNFYTGIQKTMGANRNNILTSILAENSLLILICIICAVFITSLFIPVFNRIMGVYLTVSFFNPVFVLSLAGLTSFTIFFISFYQAWHRDRINPVSILSGKGNGLFAGGNRSGSVFSQVITIVQLTVSIVLVVVVFTIYKQTSLLTEQKLGFNKSQLVNINNPWDEKVHSRFSLLKDKLDAMPEIKGVSASWNVPGEYVNNYSNVKVLGENTQNEGVNFAQLPVDVNFFTVLESKFLYGRNFDPELSSDSNKVIINKTGMDVLGLSDPVGQKVCNYFLGDNNSFEIIGVIDDMQYRSLKERGKPAIYYMSQWGLNNMVVRLSPGDITKSLKKIETYWKSVEPDYPFEYEFIDQKIQDNYEKELRSKTLLSVMAFLAIAISMLGILGLGTSIAQNRTKEIGIRKVNGAKIFENSDYAQQRFCKVGRDSFCGCHANCILRHE